MRCVRGQARAGEGRRGALSLSEFTARFTVSLSVESNGRELSAGSQSVVFHGPTPCSLLPSSAGSPFCSAAPGHTQESSNLKDLFLLGPLVI